MVESVPNLEDVSMFSLADSERATLFDLQPECTVCWTNRDGWPVGMQHLFVWHEEQFFITMTTHRKRVRALSDRPQSCVVVSGLGTKMPRTMVTAKTLATVHYDAARLKWFLPLFFDRARYPSSEKSRAEQMTLMNTPGRVVVAFKPVAYFSYDSREVSKAVAAGGFQGWTQDL